MAVIAIVALAGCAAPGIPTPTPSSMTPSSGYAGNATAVVIHGSGFAVRTIQPASGGPPAVDDTFQAWLGDLALEDVRRVDEQTLTATVPAGIVPGVKVLRVQGPFGKTGQLSAAYTAVGSALASISAAIDATPARVSEGQTVTVALTVANTGTTAAVNAIPDALVVTGTGTVGSLTGPDPATLATLAPGGAGTFTWTYLATGAGLVGFSGGASATDSFSGTSVLAATNALSPTQVTVERPAALAASLPSSGSASFNKDFLVTMTVTNQGGAAATNVVPSALTMNPAGMASYRSGPVPASVNALAGGASSAFTWTYLAGATTGPVAFSGAASGADGNSGAAVTAPLATSGSYVIGAANLGGALAAAPATVSVGQTITVTLTVTNSGVAAVGGFTLGAMDVSSSDYATATRIAGPTPAAPSTLAAGQTYTGTWTYSPGFVMPVSSGHLRFALTASGTDAVSGDTLSAPVEASVTVEAPAALAATLALVRTPAVAAGDPFTVDVNQLFGASLSVSNSGTASALAVTSSPIAGCGAPSPVSAPVARGSPVVFSYAGCVSVSAGTWVLSATASGTDANDASRAVTSGAATASATVQTAAAVTATALAASPSSLSTGQGFTVSLTLAKTGGATANLTALSLTGVSCATPPATPVNHLGATTTLIWSGCTAPLSAQTLNLSATATWAEENSGVSQVAGPISTAVPVVAAAAVTATSITATPSTVTVDQTFTISLTLSKSGGSTANVTGVSMDYAGACTTAPVLPVNAVPATVTLTWTGCTAPATPQLFSISGFATWVDANVPGTPHTTNSTSSAVTVQAAAGLAVTFSAQPPSPVSAGQAVTLTANVRNTAASGGASANAVTVAPTFTGAGGASASCGSASPGSSTIAAGDTLAYSFTCTPSGSGTITYTATANGTAANTSLPLSAAATTSPATTVQAPAGLAVTFSAQPPSPVSAGQAVTLTANVRNTAASGGASATAVTVTPTFTGAGGASASCGSASPGASTIAAGNTLAYSFTCTPSGAGTLSFTATASGTAANTSLPLTAAATTSPATTVLAAAGLAVTFSAQPPSPVSAGQAVTLTASVRNTAASGGASATAVTVTPTFTGAGGASASCGSASPGSSAIAAGNTLAYSFTCTPSGAGTITFTATASGTAAGTGSPLSAAATTSPATTVQAAAGLSVSFDAQPPSPVSAGQAVTLTANVRNTAASGGASATAVTVTPTFTGAGGASASCGSASPGASTIAAGNTLAYSFTCTPSGSGTITFTATANGTAANTSLPLTAAATTSPATSVQTAASVGTVSLTTTPAIVLAGNGFSVTLSISKTGQAQANVTGASLTGEGVSCTPPALPILDVGPAQDLTWDGCVAFPAAATVPIEATVTWVDANVPGTPVTSPPLGGSVVVQ